jgi:hypothetical protein
MKVERYEAMVEEYENNETRVRVLFLKGRRSVIFFFQKVPRLHPFVLLIRAV